MGRMAGTLVIGLLLILDLALPSTPLGRRGSDPQVRHDVAGAVGQVGQPLPDLTWTTLEGERVSLADFRGHRLVLTFERSLDW
ncbi:MAG: hypothetical protein ACE5IL_16285 [Myxococcota bacterium]